MTFYTRVEEKKKVKKHSARLPNINKFMSKMHSCEWGSRVFWNKKRRKRKWKFKVVFADEFMTEDKCEKLERYWYWYFEAAEKFWFSLLTKLVEGSKFMQFPIFPIFQNQFLKHTRQINSKTLELKFTTFKSNQWNVNTIKWLP